MKRLALTVAGLLASTAPVALAQAPVAQPQVATVDDDEVVVTAQRREERLQDVPISVSAITAEALGRQGITSTADLPTVVPGLNMAKSSTVVQPYLRGIGTANLAPGSDPSVPVYIDGVYHSAPAGLLFAFNNIQRVEVLKGPQGTLFGRNSTGGLVQVITSDPTSDPTLRVSLGYANYDTLQTSGYVSGGTDRIAADFAVVYNNQRQGWGRNFYQPGPGEPAVSGDFDREAGDLEEVGVRSKVVLHSDNTDVKLSGMYLESSGSQGHYRHLLPGTTVLVVNPTYGYTTPYTHGSQGEGFYDYNSDTPWTFENSQYMFSAEVDQDVEFATVKSITSYLSDTALYNVPSDSSPQISTSTSFSHLGWDTFTQEFQILSNPESAPSWLNWIAGLYYLNSTAGYQPLVTATGNELQANTLRFSDQNTESYAVYAQETSEILPNTRLTLGARYTRDIVTAEQYNIGANPSGSGATLLGNVTALVTPHEKSFDSLTWHASLDYHFTPNVMAYLSASRGFKSGSWNHGSLCSTTLSSCPTVAPPVNPEVVLAYEAGLRSDLFSNRLRFNASVFRYDYSDLQIQAVVGSPPVSLLVNAASARINGAEIDLIYHFTPNFTVNYNASFLDTEYTSFPGAIAFTPRTAAPWNAAQITIDATGNELSRSPPYSSTLGVNYLIPTSHGQFELNANWFHTDSFYWEPQNRLKQDGYDLLNAQLAWRPTEHLQFRLWGKNLTGEEYYTYQFTSTQGGDQGNPAAPRTFGVAVDWAM